MFDVFVPTNRATGGCLGFGFLRFKTEWDANKAISFFNGRLVGGKRIFVQMAQHDKGNKSLSVAINRKVHGRTVPGGGV